MGKSYIEWGSHILNGEVRHTLNNRVVSQINYAVVVVVVAVIVVVVAAAAIVVAAVVVVVVAVYFLFFISLQRIYSRITKNMTKKTVLVQQGLKGQERV